MVVKKPLIDPTTRNNAERQFVFMPFSCGSSHTKSCCREHPGVDCRGRLVPCPAPLSGETTVCL
jgi:hypothetical protein